MNRLQDKMLNYEVTPPASAWEKIAAELDEADLMHQYPSRLYAFEVAPPATAWEHIKTSLATESVPVVNTAKRRTVPFLRYAAAAAIIGLLAWGASSLLSNNSKDQPGVASETNIPDTNISNTQSAYLKETGIATNSTGGTSSQEDDARNDAALEASKKTYATLTVPVNSKLKGAADFYFAATKLPAGNTRSLDYDDPPANPDEENNLSDRYIMLMTPDGNIIRMSKKLGNLVCCVSGEEQDQDCLDQMKLWREKMANASVGHSSGNFMDIVNLVSSLQGYED